MEKQNWRLKVGKKREINELSWRIYLHQEFVEFAEEVAHLAKLYHWNFWGGGVNNFAVTLSQDIRDGESISICILPGDYHYYACFKKEYNPNHLSSSDYCEKIGETMDEALKYLHIFLLEHPYTPRSFDDLFCIMGGAYDRYPLAKKWAYEELESSLEEDLVGNH